MDRLPNGEIPTTICRWKVRDKLSFIGAIPALRYQQLKLFD